MAGDTREAGETVDTSFQRELREGAGACVVGVVHPVGARIGAANGPVPYRPYLPHPEKAWL